MTEKKPRGRPFQRGKSGNPTGRPSGVRNKTTMLAEQMMEADAKEIVQAILTEAKTGNMVAARLVLERIVPVRKSRLVSFKLPEIATVHDVHRALGKLVELVGAGTLDPDEGSTIAGMIESQRRSIEIVDLERRIAELEGKEHDRE